MNTLSKVPFLSSFLRSQAASFLATLTDFLVLIFATEILGIWYVASTAIGATAGAIVSFYLGRNWAFERKEGHVGGQAFRYVLTSGASLLLNMLGVYLITELGGAHYVMSKLIISVLVGVFFNFFMFRYFVFR